MEITVTDEFIEYRGEKQKQYNQRGRSDRVFLMNLDAELLEWTLINQGLWESHESWMVDAINHSGLAVDVKFIRKYWNVSREKTLNLIKQRNILDGFDFYKWVQRPNRPLQSGDVVTIERIGYLGYGKVADNLRKSYKEPDGFYVDVLNLNPAV